MSLTEAWCFLCLIAFSATFHLVVALCGLDVFVVAFLFFAPTGMSFLPQELGNRFVRLASVFSFTSLDISFSVLMYMMSSL